MQKVTESVVVCKECGSELKSEVHETFCDNCKVKIKEDPFNIDIFWKDHTEDRSDSLNFCTLKCMKEWLLKFPYNKNEVEFITLPYIHNIDDLQSFLNGKE